MDNDFNSIEKNWHKENLAGYATIEFPNKPQLSNSENGLMQIGYNDKINFFIVDIENLSNFENLEVSSSELSDLYRGIIVDFFENQENRPPRAKRI